MSKTQSQYEIRAAGKVSVVIGRGEMVATVQALKDHGWQVQVRRIA